MLTNQDIRRRFQHVDPTDQSVVDAHRRLREVLAGAATEINELLAEGEYKHELMRCLERARLYGHQSIALDGLWCPP